MIENELCRGWMFAVNEMSHSRSSVQRIEHLAVSRDACSQSQSLPMSNWSADTTEGQSVADESKVLTMRL